MYLMYYLLSSVGAAPAAMYAGALRCSALLHFTPGPSAAVAGSSSMVAAVLAQATGPLSMPVHPAYPLAQAPICLQCYLRPAKKPSSTLPHVADFIDCFASAKRTAPGGSQTCLKVGGTSTPSSMTRLPAPAASWARQATDAVCHTASAISQASYTPFQSSDLGAPLPCGPCHDTRASCQVPVGPGLYKSAAADGLVGL